MRDHAMKKYRWNSNHKDDEIRQLLLNTIDIVEKDNEYLRVINHQLKAKGERQMASFTADEKALVAYSERAEKADQFQDLRIRAAQLQSRLNTPPIWIYQPKDRVPFRKERDGTMTHRMETSGLICLKMLNLCISSKTSEPAEVVHSSLVEVSTPLLPGGDAEAYPQ